MHYLKCINRFWDFNQKIHLGSTAITMYLYLLKIGYDKKHNGFKISDVAISKELGLTRKTVKSTKEKLKYFGLIQFETKNGSPCSYKLVLNYSFKLTFKDYEMKELPKTKQSVKKMKSSAIVDHKDLIPTDIPTFNEFLEYAKTLENYEFQLDSKLQVKYETWKKRGWRNGLNRSITNWKASLKSALPFIKKTDSNTLSLQSIPKIKNPKFQNGD